MRGRLASAGIPCPETLFQSTPPCGGDNDHVRLRLPDNISIHAPLRGRLLCLTCIPSSLNFNPRPLAGATYKVQQVLGKINHFNPRPLAGATDGKGYSYGLWLFQSTPPCGGDKSNSRATPYRFNFNPRPLAGATLLHMRPADGLYDFNPRPLAGATSIEARRVMYAIFQSTPPCGGDRREQIRRGGPVDFNPRPLAGATSINLALRDTLLFQSTPPCGGDSKELMSTFGADPFQSTPPCGGDLLLAHWLTACRLFQSTPPCGGDCQTGQLEFYKRFRLFSRKSVHGSPKPHFPVLVPSVRFPLALTAPWGPQGRRFSWLPSAGFCSDMCFPDYRTADCRGLCR